MQVVSKRFFCPAISPHLSSVYISLPILKRFTKLYKRSTYKEKFTVMKGVKTIFPIRLTEVEFDKFSKPYRQTKSPKT